jgi:hypothetical protein
MARWLVPTLVAFTLLNGSASLDSACAASLDGVAKQRGTLQSTEPAPRLSHRRERHAHADRPPYRPRYYDRPYYYRPYPYDSPAPFVFGLNFGPWWP